MWVVWKLWFAGQGDHVCQPVVTQQLRHNSYATAVAPQQSRHSGYLQSPPRSVTCCVTFMLWEIGRLGLHTLPVPVGLDRCFAIWVLALPLLFSFVTLDRHWAYIRFFCTELASNRSCLLVLPCLITAGRTPSYIRWVSVPLSM
jgi:hypothetical protein